MKSTAPYSRFDRAMNWWDTSLFVNWVLMPLGLVWFCWFLNISELSGISEAAKSAPTTTISGKADRSGYRRRRLVIIDKAGERHFIGCGQPSTYTCMPMEGFDPKLQPLTLTLFKFKGGTYLISAKDFEGRVIVSREAREKSLRRFEQDVVKDDASTSVVLGLFFGLVISVFRFLFYVWPRRRRQSARKI